MIGRDVLSPLDLERIFGMHKGNIFHGSLSLHQLAYARPVPGYAHHRTPLRGLYLASAGTHPGGGVRYLQTRVYELVSYTCFIVSLMFTRCPVHTCGLRCFKCIGCRPSHSHFSFTLHRSAAVLIKHFFQVMGAAGRNCATIVLSDKGMAM